MTSFIVQLTLAIGAYSVAALILFGDVYKPIAFASLLQNRLGAPFWQALIVVGGIVAVALTSMFRVRFRLNNRYFLPGFIFLWMSLSVLFVGIYAEGLRFRAVNAFGPDDYRSRPFMISIRKAPRDFQLFLHAAALKDCQPYAWSYRQMDFYKLSPNVAINVAPGDWIKRCAIERTR